MSIGEQSVKFMGLSKSVRVAQPPDSVASNRHLSWTGPSAVSRVEQLIIHCEPKDGSVLGGESAREGGNEDEQQREENRNQFQRFDRHDLQGKFQHR